MAKSPQTVAVVGVGSVGGYFGAQAMVAGHQVSLCTRTGFERLVVETGGNEIVIEDRIYQEPANVDVHDWVLLAVKAHHTESTAPWLSALCNESTVVAVLQNGVEHVERVRPYVDGAEVLPTVVRYGGEATEPGRITHYTYGYLLAPDDPAGRRLAELFDGSEAEVETTSEFEKEAWSKLVTNVAANAIPAITQQRFPVFRRADIADLAEKLMLECIEVAASVGVALDRSLARSEVERLAGLPDNVGSSMLYDRLAGRSLEYDALNGAVVRIGARNGVRAPLNEAVVALLGAISDAATS
jgi:2-dehydropantoate 2-reductase